MATESANTKKEAAKEALKAAQPQTASAEAGVTDDSSDDDVEEICTVQEATEIVRAPRDVLLMARNTSSEEQRHFVQCLGTMKDAFLRMRVAEQSQRQLRISEF